MTTASNAAINKKGRLVVRNLVYDINEKHLRNLFSKYGEISEINLPINPSTNKSKGFAFVQFINKNNALKAINELNESKFKGRTILLDLAFEKKQYEKFNQDKKPDKTDENAIEEEEKNEDKNEDEEENNEDEVENDKEEGLSNENVENAKNNKKKNQSKIQEDQTKTKDEEEKNLENAKKAFSDENLDNTVFITNLPYEISDKEFIKFASNFGSFQYAKLVKNKETGENKGTGFIKFKDKKTADYVVELSDQLEQNPSNLNSIDSNYMSINERRVEAKHAKNRGEIAQKEKENKARPVNLRKIKDLENIVKLDRKNKRKLHLAKLGVFQPTDDLTEEEKEKRTIYIEEKIQKLKNPNFFVSETRILLKHLPKKNFDENTIKEIVQSYLKGNVDPNILKKKKMIKRIKLLRNKDLLDDNGHPKSKGMAFVEFSDPEDAINFINYFSAKENYSIFNKAKTPIIEFSIEDIRKTRKIEKILSSHKSERKKTEKDIIKQKQINQKTHSTKFLIEDLINKKDPNNLEEIKNYLKNIKSRGIKQRLHKKIFKNFGIHLNENPDEKNDQKNDQGKIKNVNEKKKKPNTINKQDKTLIKKEKNVQKVAKEIQNKAEINQIIKTRKEKTKLKRKAIENDEFDEIAENYKQKVQKKVKWNKE